MKIVIRTADGYSAGPIPARCPHCGREVILEPLGVQDIHVGNNILCGQRRCPNKNCNGHLFVVLERGRLAVSYPRIKIDFDSTSIPQKICDSFEQAITCHAEKCFPASAIMVRRTLEEICEDRQADGADLKARLLALKSKIVLPQELTDAMDELRLLGNDAAHVEAKSYDQIGSDELEVAISLAKEIMKGIYQYSKLLEQLRGLKKKPAS